MNHTKRLLGMTILLLAALLLDACATNPADQSAFPRLRIGSNAWPGFGAVYIADQQHLFEQEGVEVEVVNYDSYDTVATDLAMKRLDGGLLVLSDGVAQAAAGVSLETVWAFDNSAGGDVVVANADIQQPQDLRGKRVGLSYGTFGQLFVVGGLGNYGLTEDDVTIVNMPADQVPAALAAGQIDAGHTWEPFLSQALSGGAHVLFTSADTPGVVVDALMFQTIIVEQRPDDVQAVVRAIAEADDWWRQNPQEGNQLIAQTLNMPVTDFEAFLSGVRVLSLHDNLAAFNPSSEGAQSLYVSAQFASDLFTDSEIIDQSPDIEALINPSFVQALSGG